jgi:hypothetical protein
MNANGLQIGEVADYKEQIYQLKIQFNMSENITNTNENGNCANRVLECAFCHGTGIALFVDMSKVPDYTSMTVGDETWKKYEEFGECPEGCRVMN